MVTVKLRTRISLRGSRDWLLYHPLKGIQTASCSGAAWRRHPLIKVLRSWLWTSLRLSRTSTTNYMDAVIKSRTQDWNLSFAFRHLRDHERVTSPLQASVSVVVFPCANFCKTGNGVTV